MRDGGVLERNEETGHWVPRKRKANLIPVPPPNICFRVCECFSMNSTVFFLSVSFWAHSIASDAMYQRPRPCQPRSDQEVRPTYALPNTVEMGPWGALAFLLIASQVPYNHRSCFQGSFSTCFWSLVYPHSWFLLLQPRFVDMLSLLAVAILSCRFFCCFDRPCLSPFSITTA